MLRLVVLVALIAGVVSLPDASGAATTYIYDDLGRLSTASYDNGKQIVYNYDPAGNRSSVVTQTTPMHLSIKKTHVPAAKKPSPKR